MKNIVSFDEAVTFGKHKADCVRTLMDSGKRIHTLFSDRDPNPGWKRTSDEIACALELNTLNSFRTQFRKLRTRFGSFRQIVDAEPGELGEIGNWSLSARKKFLEQKSKLNIGKELSQLPGDIRICTYFDTAYPAALRDLYDPPPVLYIRGRLEYDFRESISIVGSRVTSEYGRSTTDHFAFQLASWGFMVISGGARGIDSIAHKAALNAGGRTMAVFGCGLNITFPAENSKLFTRIAEKGALVSEFPVNTVPEKYNFPARNRLIAALGRGTIVIEAGEKSGALITADLASQIGREVFAVPGRLIDGQSMGTNRLIADGAIMALNPMDIPVRFGLTISESDQAVAENVLENLKGDEAVVFEAVGLEAKEADIIVREVGIEPNRVLAALLVLQTRGLVRELPGSRFIRPVYPAGNNTQPPTT